MDQELRELENILQAFPSPDDHVLEHISKKDAKLIWRYALKYLEISKEIDMKIKRKY